MRMQDKIADPIKKSPKGFTATIERVAGSKTQKPKVLTEEKPIEKKAETGGKAENKSKKKSLDDLLEGGMI